MTAPRILPLNDATRVAVCRDLAGIVKEGGVIAVPTESFYALGCDPLNPEAVRRVCAIKGRPPDQPILVLIASREHVTRLASFLPPVALALMDTCWPGPLTLVLPARSGLPEALTAGTGTVGLRWSAHPELSAILSAIGPLTGTSANRSGHPPCRSASEVEEVCGGAVERIADAGLTAGGPPSTVLDVTDRPRLVREGAVPASRLRELLARIGETLA
jgi:L-threonylcarbamoyladenylate synthase